MAKKRTEIVKNKKAHLIGNQTSPRLLPLKTASEYLGLTVWALRERIWAGQIPVVQFPGGRKQYIDMQDIDAFIQKNKKVIN